MKRAYVIVPILLVFGILGVSLQQFGNTEPLPAKKSAEPQIQRVPTTAQPGFNKELHSLEAADSIWAVINKRRPLQPASYIPSDLTTPDIAKRPNITSDERQIRQQVAVALQSMFAAAARENISLSLLSGYRSYGFQTNLYNRYVSQQGQVAADLESARPGHSEHQTGLAADIGGVTNPACNLEQCFNTTPEGKWLTQNAHKYGFIIRYPEGKTPVTGYSYEPWHARYVGPELATEMKNKSADTMEEFFELPPAPDYH